jgi:hypothetical protein
MISTKPISAARDIKTLGDQVKAFVVAAREAAEDGLTVSEFAELAVALLRLVIATLDTIPVDGEQKKKWAVDAVGMLFDETADKVVPVIAWPLWMIVRPTVRQLVLLATAGAIESLLPIVRAST